MDKKIPKIKREKVPDKDNDVQLEFNQHYTGLQSLKDLTN